MSECSRRHCKHPTGCFAPACYDKSVQPKWWERILGFLNVILMFLRPWG